MYSKMLMTIKIKYQFYFIKRKVKKTKIKLIKINKLTKKIAIEIMNYIYKIIIRKIQTRTQI